MKMRNVAGLLKEGLLKRLASAVAPYECDPIIRWKGDPKSAEIRRINDASFCLTGDARLSLTLDLFDLLVCGDARQVKDVFGDTFMRPTIFFYSANNFGGVIQSLHMNELFSILPSTSVLGHRPNWKEQRGKISFCHAAILSRWKWEDHTRFDDNRQEDNIRFTMNLPVWVKNDD